MGLAGKRPPKSTLQILEDYFNITSCHALGNIVNDGVVGNPLGRRIFWGLFWIIAFIYLSLFTVEQFTVFFDFPTTTAIDFANGDFVQFPAVSFCSSNPISFSDVKYGPNNTTFSETSLTLTQTSFEHLEKWGYRWDDILLEARRPDGSLINGSSLEPYLDDNYGNCWTIKDMGSVSFPGTSEAAQFTFNVRPIDYMQDIKQTAVVMTVHDPKAKPFMPAGFTARAGDSTTVQIRQILLTRLPDPYSKCWCREGVDNPKHGTCKTTKPADYNINSCKRSCVFQRAKLRCGCAPGFMDGVPVHCMNCSSDPTVACESRDCLRKILDDIGTNADPCACKQACTEVVSVGMYLVTVRQLGYDISVSHATYPNLVDPAVMSRANNDCWDKIAVQLNNDPLFAARCYVDTTLEAVLDETVTGLAPCPLTVSDIETIAADHMTRVIDNNPSAPASGLVADMVAYKGLLQVIELMVAGGFDTLDPFTVSQCGVKYDTCCATLPLPNPQHDLRPVSSERWVQEPSQTYVRAAWDYERSVKARVLVYFSEFTTETVTWEASMLPMGLLSGVGGTFGLFLGISFATLAEFIELIGIVLLDVIGLTKICQPQCGRGSVAPDNKASDKSAGDVEMAETTTTPSAPPIVLVSNDQAA